MSNGAQILKECESHRHVLENLVTDTQVQTVILNCIFDLKKLGSIEEQDVVEYKE